MVAWLKSQNIDYFVVEAIDQPWKAYDLEGKAGGYWGLWNADRQQKFDWSGPIETFPRWWLYAAWSIAGALPLMAFFLWRWTGVGSVGQLAFCGLACLATSAVAYGASVAAGTYMITAEMVGWGMLAFFLVLSLAMALVQALELGRDGVAPALDARGLAGRRDAGAPAGRSRLAEGLAPCRDLQRAAGDGDADPRIRWRRSTTPTSK